MYKKRGNKESSIHKKGYFFSIDAFISAAVLSLGLFLIFSAQTQQLPKEGVEAISEDLINTLSNTRIYQINDDAYPSLQTMKNDGRITRFDNTLLEQVGEFYYFGGNPNMLNLRWMLIELTTGILPQNYRFSVHLYEEDSETELYRSTGGAEPGNSKNLISFKILISGIIDESTMWGPYMTEVRVWQ